MDKQVSPRTAADTSPMPQSFYLDGCKVTVTYSNQNNPNAVRAIRDVLIGSIPVQKA